MKDLSSFLLYVDLAAGLITTTADTILLEVLDNALNPAI